MTFIFILIILVLIFTSLLVSQTKNLKSLALKDLQAYKNTARTAYAIMPGAIGVIIAFTVTQCLTLFIYHGTIRPHFRTLTHTLLFGQSAVLLTYLPWVLFYRNHRLKVIPLPQSFLIKHTLRYLCLILIAMLTAYALSITP